MQAWREAEGGRASYNPFNVTRKTIRGRKNDMFAYNSVGVQNYRTFEDGVQATVETLKLSYYTGIVEGLKEGRNPLTLAREEASKGLATWKGQAGGGYIAAVLESNRLRPQINEFVGRPNAAPGPDIDLIWKIERQLGGVSGQVNFSRDIGGGI